MKHNYIEINHKHYEVSSIYSFFTFSIEYILMFIYFFAFIFILAKLIDYSIIIIILGLALSLIGMYVIWEFIKFIFTFFAPLKEVEKPKEEVKKMGFFDRYRRYKEKRMNQLKDEDKK